MNWRDKAVFLHVPRTGGTSFRRLLTEIYSERRVSPPFAVGSTPPAKRLARYRVISGHISWLDLEPHLSSRRLFTLLRDPIDRCLSLYTFFQQDRSPLVPLDRIRGDNRAEEATSLARQLDPDDFFVSRHPHVRQNLDDRMVWQIGHHAALERRDIPEREALQRAIDHLERFAFVGLHERLESEIPRFLSLVGVASGRHAMPHLNPSSRVSRRVLGSVALRALEGRTQLDRQLYETVLGRVAQE